MQKNVPIVLGVVVLLVVVIVIASMASRRREAGPARPGTTATAPAYTAAVRPTTQKEQVKYQETLGSALAKAQKLYDAKDYQGAFDKTKEILETIDSTSQGAKNLKQMAQIRMIEQRRAGTR